MHIRHLLAHASSFIVMAAGPAAAQSAFQGAYVGGYGSYSHYDVDVTVTGIGSGSFDAGGFGFGGFVGFGLRNQALYGGLEGEVGYDGADEDGLFGTTVSVESRLTYGIAFRGGWVIDERFLPYVRIGWQRANFEASAPGAGSRSEDLDALRIGAGLEALVSERLSFRAEYAYSPYSDYEESIITVAPDQHLFRVGVALHF